MIHNEPSPNPVNILEASYEFESSDFQTYSKLLIALSTDIDESIIENINNLREHLNKENCVVKYSSISPLDGSNPLLSIVLHDLGLSPLADFEDIRWIMIYPKRKKVCLVNVIGTDEEQVLTAVHTVLDGSSTFYPISIKLC